ncbi:hypothetical protein CWO90_13975 [Bradyrhizobium sp. Leo121]|nr:hypothetical protein CWO90_13975 [Bradyrhizobium sp. Leo121]
MADRERHRVYEWRIYGNTVTESEYLSVQEVAERYGVSQSTVRREINRGRLRARLIKSAYAIRPSDAENWLAQNGNMARVFNLSKPGSPSIAIAHDLLRVLVWASLGGRRGYRIRSDADKKLVERLRVLGFEIEVRHAHGRPAEARAKDFVEVCIGGGCHSLPGPGPRHAYSANPRISEAVKATVMGYWAPYMRDKGGSGK